MKFKKFIKSILNSIFKLVNNELISTSLIYDWQRIETSESSFKKTELPEGAKEYLQFENPRFIELRERYSKFENDVTAPFLWDDDYVSPENLLHFRGDNPFVYQLRGLNKTPLNYSLTTYFIKSMDNLNLLEKLKEDELFGNFTFNIDNKTISRDLLDSISEIYFLEKHLKISSQTDYNILDIGAGYGRMAHRVLEAFPSIKTFYCTDAVALSTFISEYYLRFRKLEDRSKVLPVDEVEEHLENKKINLAINIHSFSECTLPAIEWWLAFLKKSEVKYLMIVPNATNLIGDKLLTNDKKDFSQIIEKNGYKLLIKEPKYSDSEIQKYAIDPTFFHLFELQP